MADFISRTTNKKFSASNGGGGISNKNVYDDVFGRSGGGGSSKFGISSFSSRGGGVEDYTEIFTSSRGSSSIPILDLPVDDDDTDFNVPTSKIDYFEIFGGFDSVDYAVPYEDLFVETTKVQQEEETTSSEDVWTPAETGSPSEVSSEDPVCLDSNQVFSNMQPHYAYDGVKQFNVSYHKTNQIRKEDGISGTTHIAQLDAIPAYTFVVDENLPFQTAKHDNPLPEVANAQSLNANVTDWRMDGEHFWETTPTQPAGSTVSCTDENGQQPQKNPDKNGTYNEKPFVTVSEISLRTHPSEVPPPSRPPPKLSIKHVSHKVMSSDLKPSANYARQGAERDGSPPFFDVEVDSSSSAAASAAAMKEAMEQAQATLKSAKELMERKKDSLQHRKKFGMKEDSKGKDRRESNIAFDSISNKKEKSHRKFEREDNDLKRLDREERLKSMEVPQVAPTVEVKQRSFNVSKGSVVHREEHRVAQESQREEVIGEWKAEEQFYELVKKDTAGAVPGHKKSERKSIPTIRAHEHEQNEKKAEMVAFVKQLKNDDNSQAAEMACDLKEDDKRVNVVKEARDRAATDQKIKAALKSCDHEEHEKRQKAALDLKESEIRLKQVREREVYEKKLKETLEQEKKEACEREEYERRLKEAHERAEHEKKLKDREREANEKKREEALQREENERKQREIHEREENKKKQEAREREENERRQKEACEKEENERRINEKNRNEAYQRAENERIHKEAREMEESEKIREENERKLKQDAAEKERRLKEVHEQEKNEKIQKEENEKRLKELYEREESERTLKQDATDNEMRLNAVHEQEKNEKMQKEAREHKENENNQREHFEEKPGEPVDNEKKLRESREQIECEMKADESSKRVTIDKELERESEQEGVKKTHREAVEMEGNDKCGLSQDLNVRNEEIAECERTVKTGNDSCIQDEYKNSEASCGTCQQEQSSKKLGVAQESCRNGEIKKAMETTQYNIEQTECVKSFKEDEVLNEQDRNERLRDAHMSLSPDEHTGSDDSQLASPKEDSEKSGQPAFRQEKDEKCRKEDLFPLDGKGRKRGNQPSQVVGHSVEDEMKTEVVHPRSEEEKITKPKLADEYNTNHDKGRKEKNLNGSVSREEGKVKEREQEKERLRKLEEDIQRERDREREREKDRMAVERVTREVRERAYAEARERAERAALERATAEARQREMAEARERLEKACAEARERSLTEKAYKEARLRAERAAVERATAEARERAVEKAAMEARERVERSVSDKFSTTSRDSGLRHTASFSDLRERQFQSSSSFSFSQRNPNSSNPGAFVSEKSQGSEVESAQRCKARLERHQRTVERAAKALAEKNLRDHLAQREQAERNRLAETLDADVKRWSSGKAGNLRALLSTLQYILGPDSGWQPIPLTEVITAVAVKKAYRKATLCVHPDKLQQRGASIQQKYICEKVFDLLKDAWNKFNSEER